MSIDNLYFIRTLRKRIPSETKSRSVCSVSSLLRPFPERERARGSGNTRLRANIRTSSLYSLLLPPSHPVRRDFKSLLCDLITSPETCFLVAGHTKRRSGRRDRGYGKNFHSGFPGRCSARRHTFGTQCVTPRKKNKLNSSCCRGACDN